MCIEILPERMYLLFTNVNCVIILIPFQFVIQKYLFSEKVSDDKTGFRLLQVSLVVERKTKENDFWWCLVKTNVAGKKKKRRKMQICTI